MIIAPQDVTTTLFGLTITTSNATAAYQWIDCATNDPISGETGISYNVTANGSYAVIITENGCSDTSACTVIDFVGIDGLDFQTLSLFPNPTANGMFSINTEGVIKEIELIDMMGRIVQVEINLTDKTGVDIVDQKEKFNFTAHHITTSQNFIHNINNRTYDIILCDGDRDGKVQSKDILDSYNILNNNGYIVFPTIIPLNPIEQMVPRM
mgnify:CR=1 FL=1